MLADEGRPGLDPALAIGYLEQAAEALDTSTRHDPPVVHGDVKPANLILTSSGRIVLVDFGSVLDSDRRPRRAGTAGYVAPEVAAGEAHARVGRLLARRDGPHAADRRALRPGATELGRARARRIPALERIVRPNLATDPWRRDASATAFVARLQRWWGAPCTDEGGDGALGGTSDAMPAGPTEPSWTRSLERTAATARAMARRAADVSAFTRPHDGLDAARELAASLRDGGWRSTWVS